MLVVVAHRRIETLGEGGTLANRIAEHDARARQDDRELRLREQLRGRLDGLLAAGRTLELDDLGQVDVDNLRPQVARHVDLAGADRRQALVMTRFRTSAMREASRTSS